MPGPSDADDLTVLGNDQLEALGALIFQPSRYLQRVVEHLSFLPAGGERWQREIQLRIPVLETRAEPKEGKCIVSLGMFRRSRFPDFTVKDASGERLNLLTRRQHQHCITVATIRQYLDEDDWKRAPAEATAELLQLYEQMASIITNIKGPHVSTPEHVGVSARALMERLGKQDSDRDRVASELEVASGLLSRYTHYLCWVPAKWGETLAISATYTMSDTVRVAGKPRKALDTEEAHWWRRLRTRAYTSLNLFPVLYELRAPAHDHAGSYYFTIEPPEDAHVSMLDWGHGRSVEGESTETDCAHATCHIHNGERLKERNEDGPEEEPIPERHSIAGAKISAFLRADPVDHAALIAVALLNIGLAYLAQKGEFVAGGSDGQQQWLILAPTLVVALIAQHRRRYYSSATRSVRYVLWAYLAVNALFGASIAFDVSGGDTYDDIASAAMVVISVALIVLLVASGDLFERVTNRKWKPSPAAGTGSEKPDDGLDQYLRCVREYADVTALAMVIAAVVAVVVTQSIGWGEERRDHRAAKEVAAEAGDTEGGDTKGGDTKAQAGPRTNGEAGKNSPNPFAEPFPKGLHRPED